MASALLGDDGVAQQAKAGDLHLEHIPARSQSGGVRREPTPSGVSVAMMSPGCNGVIADTGDHGIVVRPIIETADCVG